MKSQSYMVLTPLFHSLMVFVGCFFIILGFSFEAKASSVVLRLNNLSEKSFIGFDKQNANAICEFKIASLRSDARGTYYPITLISRTGRNPLVRRFRFRQRALSDQLNGALVKISVNDFYYEFNLKVESNNVIELRSIDKNFSFPNEVLLILEPGLGDVSTKTVIHCHKMNVK